MMFRPSTDMRECGNLRIKSPPTRPYVSHKFEVEERRDVVMIDDHEGDLQIARLCFAQSRLSNPWISFSDSADAVFHLRIAATNPARLPTLVLIKARMVPWDAAKIIEHMRRTVSEPLPFTVIVMVNSEPEISEHADAIAMADGVIVRPRVIQEYLDFFNGIRVS